MTMTSVLTPFIIPATCLVAAGKGRSKESGRRISWEVMMVDCGNLLCSPIVDALLPSEAVRCSPLLRSAVSHRLLTFFEFFSRVHKVRCLNASLLIFAIRLEVGSVEMPKFTPRQRKQKHRRTESGAPVDTNVAELAPVSKDEKEARRQKLREELREQHSNVSSKKQKRLDKYIVRGGACAKQTLYLIHCAGEQT